MGVALLGILALVGLGLAAAADKKPTPKPKKKPVSKVKIVKPKKKPKKKVKRPPKKKEVAAAKKINKAKVDPKTPQGKEIVKKLAEIVVRDDPKTHPIVKNEAKKKIKAIAKPSANLAEIAKLFRAKATPGFPHVWRNNQSGALIWANDKGSDNLRIKKTHTYVKFDRALATAAQRKNFDDALRALAPPKAKPSVVQQPAFNLAELAKFFRTSATPGFPYVYRTKANNALIWANKPGADALRMKNTHTFVSFNRSLATEKQRQEWDYAMKALAPDGPTPMPPAAKKEVIKAVVQNQEKPPTPKQAAQALQIYTKNGGWQGDRSKPSQVVYDCQKRMGDPGADGIIGQGTRTRARDLGYPLYDRSHTAPGAYNKAEKLTRY